MRALTFVTGNPGKLRETRAILGDLVPDLLQGDIDLPELQGEIDEIAREKCRLAAEAIQGPVIVEDTALCFDALNGLPGPYIKWFLKKTGLDGLNNLLAAYTDKGAYACCTFAYCSGPGEEVHLFQGRCHGTIVPARGPTNFGWDPIFQPNEQLSDQCHTFAEMDKARKNEISHRSRALAKLKDFLQQDPQ